MEGRRYDGSYISEPKLGRTAKKFDEVMRRKYFSAIYNKVKEKSLKN